MGTMEKILRTYDLVFRISMLHSEHVKGNCKPNDSFLLNRLFVTLDFLQVFSGHLLIAQVEDAIVSCKGYRLCNQLTALA
jgi:hypothetical protein